MFEIKKLGYSSNPWRLIDRNGQEVYEQVVIDHPSLGKSQVSMPVCGNTKQAVIDRSLSALDLAFLVLEKRTEALKTIQATAACAANSEVSMQNALQNIIDKCQTALSAGR